MLRLIGKYEALENKRRAALYTCAIENYGHTFDLYLAAMHQLYRVYRMYGNKPYYR